MKSESVFLRAGDSALNGLQQIAGNDPTPEFVMLLGEEYDRLLEMLGD